MHDHRRIGTAAAVTETDDCAMRQWQRPWRDIRAILYYPTLAVIVLQLVITVATRRQSAVTDAAYSVPVLFVVWRFMHAGIDVSDTGIRVTRFFGSEVVPWEQLDRIEVSADEAGHSQIVLRTTSGAEVETRVYRGYPWSNGAVWLRPNNFERLVGRLRELHNQARLSSGPTT